MHTIETETCYKFNSAPRSEPVKVAGINIWVITGNYATFAPAMIERRERMRSLLLLNPANGGRTERL